MKNFLKKNSIFFNQKKESKKLLKNWSRYANQEIIIIVLTID